MQGKDKFYFSDSHNEESYSYSIANIFLGYELSSKTEFLIWGKNIFNKRYATRGFFFGLEPPSYNDKLYKVYGEPFTIGLTINHKIL
jgi:outer membrane receptor protein involved in Fe transport